jgi:hypothetical protein
VGGMGWFNHAGQSTPSRPRPRGIAP